MEIKPIPGLHGYHATKTGYILNNEKIELEPFKNHKDYYVVLINNKKYLIHDLILRTFKSVPKCIKKRPFGIHFDLDKTNNSLENLDWVDYKWSSIHHILMKTKPSNRPFIKAIKEDEVIYFNTLEQAAAFLNIGLKECWTHIKESSTVNDYNLYYTNGKDPMVNKYNCRLGVERKSIIDDKSMKGTYRPIIMFDLELSLKYKYENMAKAGKVMGVKGPVIRSRITTPDKLRLYKKRYVIVDDSGDLNFIVPLLAKKNIFLNKNILDFDMGE